eukprot:gene9777-2103_t
MEEEREKRKIELVDIQEELDYKKRKLSPELQKTTDLIPPDYYNQIMLQKVKIKYNILKKERRPKILKLKQPILDEKKREIEQELNRHFEFLKALDIS